MNEYFNSLTVSYGFSLDKVIDEVKSVVGSCITNGEEPLAEEYMKLFKEKYGDVDRKLQELKQALGNLEKTAEIIKNSYKP